MIISVFDRVENNVGKRENAGYQNFLLFQQCFEKASFPDMSKGGIVWKWVKAFHHCVNLNNCQVPVKTYLTLYHTN